MLAGRACARRRSRGAQFLAPGIAMEREGVGEPADIFMAAPMADLRFDVAPDLAAAPLGPAIAEGIVLADEGPFPDIGVEEAIEFTGQPRRFG